MTVLINFKICDNAQECSGIEACPTGAIYWNSDDKKITIDNSKCISCMRCEEACPSEAIRVGKNKTEYEAIKKEFNEDPRKISDLFVDRYGAQPIDVEALIKEENVENIINTSNMPVLIEFFEDDSIECLRRSNTISKLIPGEKIIYKKVELREKSLIDKYNISKLPSLLLFEKGAIEGKIEGFYDTEHFEELKGKLLEIINKANNEVNEDCPCTWPGCPRHGKCNECQEDHHSLGQETCCGK
ncbi:MAG: 4Fe-4S dicluster domain-containing protein [Nanoarchaeota archaeon]|jgi:Fe-S-cluster-containing hydrogenase component 2|nr:4Fe-4S dicluster domain-containing protein [Nanoarchaeota archaeon]